MAVLGSRHVMLFLVLVGFLINPLVDFLSTVTSLRVSLFSRGFVVMLIVFASIVFNATSRGKLLASTVLFFPLIPMLLWFVLGYYDSVTLVENYIILFKAVSFFSYIIILKHLASWQLDRVVVVAKLTLIVYMIFIISGALFDVAVFKSYGEGGRFGYKGIIIAQNEASGLVLAALFIAGFNFVVKKSDIYDVALFISSALSALLLGTKAAVLLPLMIMCIIAVSRYGVLKAVPYMSAVVIVGVAVFLLSYQGGLNDWYSNSLAYFAYQFEVYAKGDVMTFLLSGRNYKLSYVFNNFIYENPLYLIFGGFPMGSYSVEIDFFDLFLLMGGPIFMIYCFMLFRAFRNNHPESITKYAVFALILVLAVANTGGHVLYSALILPYLAVFCTMCSSIVFSRGEKIC